MTQLDPRVVQRFVELVAGAGHPVTQHEAARIVGISTRHGERLLALPEIRARVEANRERRAALPEAKGVVESLLKATLPDGRPDLDARLKGAELWLKHQAVLDAPDDPADDELPEGCYLVYPRAFVDD